MEKVTIGNSDLKVTRLGFGTWPLSKEDRPDEAKAIKVIEALLDTGINFIDTADAYCLNQKEVGYCERLVAKALKNFKSNTSNSIIVATKGGCIRPHGAWEVDGSPAHLKSACEHSLKSLGVDRIDLYQLHAPDSSVPLEDSIEALAKLKEQGKIRHIGLSNVSVAEIKKAQKITEIISVQNRCNPFDISSIEDGILSYCEQNKMGFIAYSPLGGDDGKYSTATQPLLKSMGIKYRVSPFQIALAWLLTLSPQMFPIPATRHEENAIENSKALDIKLEEGEVSQLNQVFGLK